MVSSSTTTGTAPDESKTTTDAIRFLSVLSRDIALTSQDLEHSVAALLKRTAQEMNMDALAIWTINLADGAFTIRESVGLSPRFVRYFNQTDRMRRTYGLFSECIKSDTSESLNSPEELSRLGAERWKNMFREEGIAALLAVPMLIGGEAIGIFSAMRISPHVFDDQERFFFGVLANQISVALKNSENYRSIEKNSTELESQISKLINLQTAFQSINQYLNESIERALTFLVEYSGRTFKSMGGALFMPSPDGTTLSLTAAKGLSDIYRTFMHDHSPRLADRNTLLTLAFNDQKPQLSERIFTDDRIARDWIRVLSEERITAVAVFPLLSGRQAFGTLVLYYDHLHPFTDEETSVLGAFSQFLGILFENQNTLSSLVSEKQKTQSIVSSLHDGLLVYDLSGTVIDINPRGVEILGATVGNLPNENQSPANTPDKGAENIKNVSSITIPDYETRLVLLSHPRETALEVMQVPLYNETRVKTGSLRILHDVTTDRRVEELKSNFVTTATHQLRTPLTGIRWGLEKLLGDQTKLGKDDHDTVEQLLAATRFMISLVNDLLNISQVEEGKRKYDFKKQNIVPLLTEVLGGFAAYVENKHLHVQVEYPKDGSLPEAMVDKSMMMLAIQNLVDNAMKYTPENGTITISAWAEASSFIISVRDSGIGISREDMQFLFSKFFRGKNAVRMETSGSGIGLFLAKNIIEDHNGRLTADSEPGAGSTFFIQLPLKEASFPVSTP